MGAPLFGIDVAGLIAEHVGPGVHEVLIERDAVAERVPGSLTGGRPKVATLVYPCRGFVENYSGFPPAHIQVDLGDCKVTLIGDTIPAGVLPLRKGDRLVVGARRVRFKALDGGDPAGAVYSYQCHDVEGPDGV